MRFVYERGSDAEQETVRARAAELAEPEGALRLLQRLWQAGSPVRVRCTLLRLARDRYVIRVEAQAADGTQRAYVCKGYGDARGAQLAALYAWLRVYWERRGEACPVITPLRYFAEESVLLLPWVRGSSLAEAIAHGREDLVRDALTRLPPVLARLHATPIAPEAHSRPADLLGLAISHWESDYPRRFREARRAVIDPLMAELQRALAGLEPAEPTLVHGDTGPGNFLHDGAQWRLLDLDTYGYADPAYDVGYLLAKLEHQCLAQPALAPRASELVRAMRGACLAAMPRLSARNVAFYYGLTLSRKTLAQVMRALPRERLAEFPGIAAPIVRRIRDALEALPQ